MHIFGICRFGTMPRSTFGYFQLARLDHRDEIAGNRQRKTRPIWLISDEERPSECILCQPLYSLFADIEECSLEDFAAVAKRNYNDVDERFFDHYRYLGSL